MRPNLKSENKKILTNIQNKADNALHKALKQHIIVDAHNDEIKTIQDAINIAQEGSVIKIAPGLYCENLYINKPGLKLEPKEKVGDIIIFVQKDPAITIDLKKGEKCFLINLKLAHSGNNNEEEQKEQNLDNPDPAVMKQNQLLLANRSDNLLATVNPKNELVQQFSVHKNLCCTVLVLGGKLFIEDCLLSLNFIMGMFKSILPAIVIDGPNSELVMNRCEIKGNKDKDTIGVLIKKADAIIKDCKIHNLKLGGIHSWTEETNKVKILNNMILYNHYGVVCVGADASNFIEGNTIENSKGPGIKIGIANKSSIIRNIITKNFVGIEVIAADPLIFNNTIDKNNSFGVFTRNYEDFNKILRCDGKIKTNLSIAGNKECGIACIGKQNYTRIESNQFIGYNRKAGIQIADEAHVFIYKNTISRNLGQGILLVETSSAVIEKNNISENLKANIAFGGIGSQNTFIVENKITGGRCEGIFMIDACQSWIIRNEIFHNNDGIIGITSVPLIENNDIIKNKNIGVMLLKDSRPQLVNNRIQQNENIGLYIRDKSHGIIRNNIISKNKKVNLIVENRIKQLEFIVQENTISNQQEVKNDNGEVIEADGDIRIPQNYDCNIF